MKVSSPRKALGLSLSQLSVSYRLWTLYEPVRQITYSDRRAAIALDTLEV